MLLLLPSDADCDDGGNDHNEYDDEEDDNEKDVDEGVDNEGGDDDLISSSAVAREDRVSWSLSAVVSFFLAIIAACHKHNLVVGEDEHKVATLTCCLKSANLSSIGSAETFFLSRETSIGRQNQPSYHVKQRNIERILCWSDRS